MLCRLSAAQFAVFFLISTTHAQAPAKALTDSLGDPLPEGAVARLGTLRLKHTPAAGELLSGAVFSPDGKKIASMTKRSFRLWDAKTGREIPGGWTADNIMPGAASAVFSPDSAILATNQNRNFENTSHIDLWDTTTGNKIRTIQGPAQYIRSLLFVNDGKTIISAGAAGDGVRWFEVATGKVQKFWDPYKDKKRKLNADTEERIAFKNAGISFNGESLYIQPTKYVTGPRQSSFPTLNYKAGSSDIGVFNLATGQLRWRVLLNSSNWSTVHAFSADGKRIAISIGPNRVELRDALTGKILGLPLLETDVTFTDSINKLSFSPDGTTVAIAGKDSNVVLWDVSNPAKFRMIHGRLSKPIGKSSTACLAFSPDSKTLLVGVDCDLQMYDVATLKEVTPWPGHRGSVDHVAFSADGKRLITSSAMHDLHPKESAVWDAATWKPLGFTTNRVRKFPNIGTPSPEHGVYAGLDGGDRFQLYDLPTGKMLGQLSVPGDQNIAARGFFAPGGRFYVLAGKDNNRKDVEQVFEVPEGKLVCVLPTFDLRANDSARHIAFSPDDQLVAVLSRDNRLIHVVETATAKIRYRIGEKVGDWSFQAGPAYLSFSPDGKQLAIWRLVEHNQVRIWDVTTGKETMRLKLPAPKDNSPDQRVCLAWAPDGRTLAVSGLKGRAAEKPMQLWETTTGKLRYEFGGHEGEVRAMAISNDGRYLASGSADTTVLIWDLLGR